MSTPSIESSTREERLDYVLNEWRCLHNCELCGKCHILKGRSEEILYADLYRRQAVIYGYNIRNQKQQIMMSQKYIYPSLFQEEEPQESVPGDKKEYDLTNLFERLAKSDFRSRFHLSKQDREYVMEKGLPTIRKHAEDFVAKRLAPAVIPNDGKQTPMRGHPVFLAQHATGCCCRGCFFKWHHISAGRALTKEEQEYAVAVLMAWIEKQMNKG